MTYHCRIELQSHINHGEIVLGDSIHQLEERKYQHDFTSPGDGDKIISLRGLPPGLDRGIEILSIEIDGSFLPYHLIPMFLPFVMEGNLYVANQKINEKEIMFNGVFTFMVDRDRLMYFPWYYSKKEIDFIYLNRLATCTNSFGCWEAEENTHEDEWSNVPYDPSLNCNHGDNFAIGCSVTYGTAVEKNLTWPSLLGYHNFGQPGIGIDSIYHIASQIVKQWSPRKIIILFPELTRRLIKFKKGDYYFRFPCTIDGPVNPKVSSGTSDFYYLKAKELDRMFEQIKKEMILDEENTYSRHHLRLLAELPCEIHVSSWHESTYKILPEFFDNVLPLFERYGMTIDGQHPDAESHKKWVENIKNHNI